MKGSLKLENVRKGPGGVGTRHCFRRPLPAFIIIWPNTTLGFRTMYLNRLLKMGLSPSSVLRMALDPNFNGPVQVFF